MFEYPVAISISPNTDNKDVWETIKILLQPGKWKIGSFTLEVEDWFKKYYQVSQATSFNSGRSAFLGILQAFGIRKDDEVLVQPFTCIAAIEPILWVGARPVFIDIDSSLNINPDLIESGINKKTKAIIVQHTFGIPADIEKIRKICDKHKLFLIEDCALSLGAWVNNLKIGMYGDAAYFSFGRDKVVSCVFGGLAIINEKWREETVRLKQFQNALCFPGKYWIAQQLLHPVMLMLVLPIYNFYFGKIMIYLLIKFHLLSKPYQKEEYKGYKPVMFPKKFPNALAKILLNQLKKLDEMNTTRYKHAQYYLNKLRNRKTLILPINKKGAVYLRFNIITKNADQLFNLAKKNQMLLGNWYRNIIDPVGVDYQKIGYRVKSCPQAEKMAKFSLNLPTYYRLNQEQLDSIINIIDKN